MDQNNIEPPAHQRSTSRRREVHHCPHCPRQYTTSTWLDNHIKVKHITRWDQRKPAISTNVDVVRLSRSPQESQPCALATDLQKMSSLLKQFGSLIDDIVPRLQEFGEVSSTSCPIDRNNLRTLKRRASSPDLREGEGPRRTGTPVYSSRASVPQASEPVRSDEPRPQNTDPVTTSFDDHRFTMDQSDYSPSVASHASTGHTQVSRLLPPQEKPLGSKFFQRQLHGESSQAPSLQEQANDTNPIEHVSGYQHESLTTRHGSALTLASSTQLLPDTQSLQSCNMSLQKPYQHNSSSQTLKSCPDCFPLGPQFSDGFDGILQECGFSSDSLIADSSDAFDFLEQVKGEPTNEDDPFTGTSEYTNWLSTLTKGIIPNYLASTIHQR